MRFKLVLLLTTGENNLQYSAAWYSMIVWWVDMGGREESPRIPEINRTKIEKKTLHYSSVLYCQPSLL